MLNGQDIFLIVIGVVSCFMGYSMFTGILPMWGFLVGGWIAYTLMPSFFPAQSGEMLYQIGAFVAGGVVGAIISVPLYFVIIFLTGGALGMMLGIFTGALVQSGGFTTVRQISAFLNTSFPPMPQTSLQFILMVVFGLVLGMLAIGFQKFMICASSAFLGGAAIITGLTGTVMTLTRSPASQGAIMMIGWLFLSLLGMFLQFRMMNET